MHSPFVLALGIFCASIILLRTIQIASRITWKGWSGHPLKFIGFTISYPFLVGGSLYVLLDREPALPLLLIGMMLYFLSERRRQ